MGYKSRFTLALPTYHEKILACSWTLNQSLSHRNSSYWISIVITCLWLHVKLLLEAQDKNGCEHPSEATLVYTAPTRVHPPWAKWQKTKPASPQLQTPPGTTQEGTRNSKPMPTMKPPTLSTQLTDQEMLQQLLLCFGGLPMPRGGGGDVGRSSCPPINPRE